MTRVYPGTIANNIITVQQMPPPTSTIFTLDFAYNTGTIIDVNPIQKQNIYDELRDILNECD